MNQEKHFVDNGQRAEATTYSKNPSIGFRFNNHTKETPITVVCEEHPEMTRFINHLLGNTRSKEVAAEILHRISDFFLYAHCHEYIQANMEVLDAWIKQSQKEEFEEYEIRQRTYLINFVSSFLAELNHLNIKFNNFKAQSKNSDQ